MQALSPGVEILRTAASGERPEEASATAPPRTLASSFLSSSSSPASDPQLPRSSDHASATAALAPLDLAGFGHPDHPDGLEGGLAAAQEYVKRLLELGEEVVSEIRSRITVATGGLTTSAGIAPNMMLAKIAADQAGCVQWSGPSSTRALLGWGWS